MCFTKYVKYFASIKPCSFFVCAAHLNENGKFFSFLFHYLWLVHNYLATKLVSLPFFPPSFTQFLCKYMMQIFSLKPIKTINILLHARHYSHSVRFLICWINFLILLICMHENVIQKKFRKNKLMKEREKSLISDWVVNELVWFLFRISSRIKIDSSEFFRRKCHFSSLNECNNQIALSSMNITCIMHLHILAAFFFSENWLKLISIKQTHMEICRWIFCLFLL